MIFRIFIAFAFYIILPITYFIHLNEVKPKKNIILGATIQLSNQGDPAVKAVTDKFKKESTITFLILTVAFIPALLIQQSSISITVAMFWMVLAIVCQSIPFIRANQSLKKLKAEKGWARGGRKNITDLNLMNVEIKSASPALSFIPFAVSLVPIIHLTATSGIQGAFSSTNLIHTVIPATILLCIVLHYVISKMRADTVGAQTDLNAALTLVRRQNWSKMFIGLNFILMLMGLGMWADIAFDLFTPLTVGIFVMGITLLSVAFAMYVEFDTRKKQYKLTAKSAAENGSIILDEDDYWIYGMFYYNPNDTHLMVADRVGSNTTINMAKPAGKLLMGLSALLLLAIPFIGVYLVIADYTPMTVEFTDSAIVARHMTVDYDLPYDEIAEMVKTTERPPLTSKINGWGTDNVQKGTFKVKDYGVCEVFMSSDADEFCIAKTKDGKYYIFGY